MFEPDEGRNAEKAREIWLLNDWITPHENFLPVLDKPMFFYWLVAVSYQLFGVTEGAARLPSALAGLACLAVVFWFARSRWGEWEALWSGLILISCLEFFIFARLVNLEMSLVFCITLALYAFYEAAHRGAGRRQAMYSLILFGALAVGTLIKGLIGFVLPGLIILCYLFWTKQRAVLRRIHPLTGASLYIAIVAPWYLMVESRHTGFLQYYLWDEHFSRFASSSFDRSQSWYFFLIVLFVGFLPWSTLLPMVLKRHWQRPLDDKTVFIASWALVPLVFFSISQSKLPQYILVGFPALAIVTGTTLTGIFRDPRFDCRRALAFLWGLQGINVLYLLAGWMWPAILPGQIRESVPRVGPFIIALGLFCASMTIVWIDQKWKNIWTDQSKVYLIQTVGIIVFLAFFTQMKVAVARERSASVLAATVAAHLDSQTQLVVYDTYLNGMPFYLNLERPVWVVTHADKRRTVAGNFYPATGRPWPDSRWGKALFTFDEFRQVWRNNERRLLIIVKQKNLARMIEQIDARPRQLTTVAEYVLLTNR